MSAESVGTTNHAKSAEPIVVRQLPKWKWSEGVNTQTVWGETV